MKRKGLRVLGLRRSWIFLLFLGILVPSVRAEPLREIRVNAAVSPTFKEDMEWEKAIRDRIIFTNQIFEPLFNIHFSIEKYTDWTPQDEMRETDLLIEELRSLNSLNDNEIVIGFHRMNQPFSQNKVIDIDTVGTAQFFRGFIIIRDPYAGLSSIRANVVMAHEVGHLFGAIHISDPDAIMHDSVPLSPALSFDESNRMIINTTRHVDFNKGLPSLPDESVSQLIEIYEAKIRANPQSDFYYQLGKFYEQLGQEAKAISIWEEALRYQYDNPYIHHELGFKYYFSGRYALAIRELGSAIAHFILPSQKKQKANALNFLGTAYYESGNIDQAIFNWLKGLSDDPDNKELQGNLAVAYMQAGDLERGLSELLKLAAKNPNDATTLSNLGAAYLRSKQPQKAIEYFEKSLEKRRPGEPKADKSKTASLVSEISEASVRLNLGAAYLDLKKPDEALAELEKVRALDPKNFDVHRNLAQAYLLKQDYEKAVQSVREAQAVKKDDPYLYAFLGQAYASMGKREEAVQAAQEGLRYTQNDEMSAMLHKNIGILYAQDKRFSEAILAFRTALNLHWKDPETHLQLGIVQARSNNFADARRSLKTVLMLDSNHEQAKKILASLPAE